jgi:hypothetical protein
VTCINTQLHISDKYWDCDYAKENLFDKFYELYETNVWCNYHAYPNDDHIIENECGLEFIVKYTYFGLFWIFIISIFVTIMAVLILDSSCKSSNCLSIMIFITMFGIMNRKN